MSAILKPLSAKPLTFWHVGGDILWRATGKPEPIERRQAEALRDIYGDEADAAVTADHDDTQAHDLFMEVSRAIAAQDQWFRVVGAEVVPFHANPKGAA